MKNLLLLVISVFALTLVGCAHGKKGCGKSCKMMKKGHHGHHGEKMFEKLDTDKDGFISRTEYDAKHKDMFSMMDTNKDKKISKEEAMAHHKGMMKKKKGCCGK